MTPSEALRLLAHAAAFDRRTVGEIEARAWAAALHDVPLDQDTLDAVARFYGDLAPGAEPGDPTRRRWLEPHHVRYHRRRIRNARIAAANLAYSGDPDETPRQAIANQRALTRAAADGRPLPRAALAARTDTAARSRALLRTLLPQITSRRPELAAACHHCAAAPGTPCRTGRGELRRDAHPTRIDASRRLNAALAPRNGPDGG
ncbi:hypothetical protein ACFQLX_14190 [Streptomyces polyrhachis]|uniref:DNA-binding phage zinc finger domain-containing protein n=1 Tax=Streptomyces polyrhachis TaxID=1282885 RepID=A0ABW2GEY6_9ACTN